MRHRLAGFVAALLLVGGVLGGGAAAQTCTLPVTLPYTLTNGTNANADHVMANLNALLTCVNNPPSSGGGLPATQGRLTLASGTPVMTSAQTGKTTIYFTPYVGNQVLITTNGTSFTAMAFTELSNVTTATSSGNAGPAAVTANSNYDLFVWSNSGTLVLTRGPAWTNDTTRSLALARVAGVWTNGSLITNGPAANLGTYVGTVRSDGSSQINWNPTPSGAAGGGNARLDVFNAYNRVAFTGLSQDTTGSWSYTTQTWRPMNGNTNNRISYIDGLGEVSADSYLQAMFTGGTQYSMGVNRNTTTAQPANVQALWAPGQAMSFDVVARFGPSLGYNYLQAMEYDTGSSSATIYGNANPTGALNAQWQTFSAMLNL